MDQRDIERLAESTQWARESTIKRLRLVPQGRENADIPDGAMSPADITDHLLQGDKALPELSTTRFKGKGLGLARQSVVASRSEYDALVDELEQMGAKRSDFMRGLTDADLKMPILVRSHRRQGRDGPGRDASPVSGPRVPPPRRVVCVLEVV